MPWQSPLTLPDRDSQPAVLEREQLQQTVQGYIPEQWRNIPISQWALHSDILPRNICPCCRTSPEDSSVTTCQDRDHCRAETLWVEQLCQLEAHLLHSPGQPGLESTWGMATWVSNAPTALNSPGETAAAQCHRLWAVMAPERSCTRFTQSLRLDRAARETGAAAESPWTDYQGSERNGKRKGKVTSVTSSDVYLWFSGSTSATECWECWIFCMAQTKCSDNPKPSRDTRSCSASRRSLKASLIHPRKMSKPVQQLLPSRMRDNDLCQIVF